ncbi:MAG: right-handed parallel beta-helix repeat-containing protein [Candidatus Thorarchaeota archaeon]
MTGITLRQIAILLLTVIIVSPGINITQPDLQNNMESEHKPEYIQSDYIIQNPIRIESDSDFDSFGFEGSGVIYDPYIIQGFNITSTAYCIYITNTTSYFTIINCSFTSWNIAIHWIDVSNGRIENCVFNRADNSAITLVRSTQCSIANCTISGSIEGISLQNATGCTIRNSLIYRNDYGISGISGTDIAIRNNMIYGNNWKGVTLGLAVDNCTLYGNKIGWNGRVQTVNGEDHGQNNVWYDSRNQLGNEWNDYEETEPYVIGGYSQSRDLYAALLSDSIPPIVAGLEDTSIKDDEEEGFIVRWNVTDEYPHLYHTYTNGELVGTEELDGNHVDIILGDMPIGVYNFTLVFTDFSGNNATDTVVIIIYATLFGEMGTPIVMFASFISVASIIALILILKRRK